jgi:MFS family permease
MGTKPATKPGLGASFWRLWSASAVSAVGDGMLVVVLPLLATTLTKDARLIAGVAVAESLPWLLFAILAGTIADRRSYRRVLVGTDLVRAVLTALIAIAALTHSLTIGLLMVGAFGLGTLRPLFDAAAYRAIPSVVDDAMLDRANGYAEATISAGEDVVGRAVGGLLYSVTASLPIIGDAISFLASSVLLRTLPSDEPLTDASAPKTSIRSDMAAGFRWFVGNRLIRTLTFIVAGLAIAQSMMAAVLVIIAQRRFGLSDRWFGVFLAGTSVGGIVGSLVAERLIGRFGQLRVIVVGILTVSVAYLVAWLTRSALVATVALSVQVGAISAANVAIITIRQRTIPRALIGRVTNVIRTFTWGALPLGSAIGGVIAQRFEPRTPLLVAAVLTFVIGVVGGPVIARRLATTS